MFAPSNFAFQKLPAKVTAFLFSSYGQKYLKALLQYHVVANQTLYSDAYYAAASVDEKDIPKGIFHVGWLQFNQYTQANILEDRSPHLVEGQISEH